MGDEDRFEELEKRLREVGERLEEIGRSVGDRIEEKLAQVSRRKRGHKHNGLFWGLAFIAAGFIWLGNRVGWFDLDIPFWPAALIVIGLYIIYTARKT